MRRVSRQTGVFAVPDFPNASQALVSATRTAALSVARFSSDVADGGVLDVGMPAEDAIVGLFQLRQHPGHEIRLDGRWQVTPMVPRGSLHFLDLRERPRAYLREQVDTLMFHLPREVLNELAEDAQATRVDRLAVPEPWRTPDPVIENLQPLIASGIASTSNNDTLLYEHLMLGIAAHFATTYGGMRPRSTSTKGGLAPWQARRARELLAANLSKDLSLQVIARECGLSVSYFGRAFRASFGTSPHAWRQSLRVERAKEALRTSREPMADLAAALGFADQSHLSRVFLQFTGMTPGAWRRLERDQ